MAAGGLGNMLSKVSAWLGADAFGLGALAFALAWSAGLADPLCAHAACPVSPANNTPVNTVAPMPLCIRFIIRPRKPLHLSAQR